jgi:hypothetical protein
MVNKKKILNVSESETSESETSESETSESESSDSEPDHVIIKNKMINKTKQKIVIINGNNKSNIKKLLTGVAQMDKKINLTYFTILGLKYICEIYDINTNSCKQRADYELKIKMYYINNINNKHKYNLILKDVFKNKKKMNWNYFTLVGLKVICRMNNIKITYLGKDSIKKIVRKKYKSIIIK